MRLEFSKPTRREALRRSGKICEAVGPEYGFKPGQRCTNNLGLGVEIHHVKEAEMGGDNSIDNALCLCLPCHRHITKTFIKELRHSDRVRDRHDGIVKPKSRLRKPEGFVHVWGRGYMRKTKEAT